LRPVDLADGSLLVEYPDHSDSEANELAVAGGARLEREKPRGFLGAVPGARTLYVEFDAELSSAEALVSVLAGVEPSSGGSSRRAHTIPVVYGGERGPDLPELARRAGLSPDDFARRHAQASYRVAFLGFAPGFAYLIGLPAELHAPRLATPRPRVPVATVAIGGPYTGIYPGETPGGWRLIGRADVRLFDPDADPPSLFLPGDAVRFEAVAQTGAIRTPEAVLRTATDQPAGDPLFRVVAPGVLSSIQGGPRYEWLRVGVPPGGAMDLAALADGNRILGNPPEAAALEMTLVGAELEVLAAATVCLFGAGPVASVNGRAIEIRRAVKVEPGDRLAVARILEGARSYLCVAGGLWQTSRPRLSPRILKGNLLFRRGDSGTPGRGEAHAGSQPAAKAPVVRVVLGPHRDHYTEEGLATFLSSPYRLSPASDRRGIRLEGPAVELARPPDIAPEGTPLGGIQVANDGLPIVLGPDRPVTGGYARIATIVRADFPLVAQASPGDLLRFTRVDLPPAPAARVGWRQ
jgi:KipI family sensor histidine kinase inhibitor